VLLEVLGLANQYGFVELQSAMSEYLKAVLNIHNVCLIFDIASMYGLRSLCDTCCLYMDHSASDVLQSEGFLALSLVCIPVVLVVLVGHGGTLALCDGFLIKTHTLFNH